MEKDSKNVFLFFSNRPMRSYSTTGLDYASSPAFADGEFEDARDAVAREERAKGATLDGRYNNYNNNNINNFNNNNVKHATYDNYDDGRSHWSRQRDDIDPRVEVSVCILLNLKRNADIQAGRVWPKIKTIEKWLVVQ